MWRAIERAIPNARELSIAEVMHTPHQLEERLGLTGGNVHHVAHTPEQVFEGRPLAVGGIRLCGAGTQPGGEVSGLPGLNAALRLLADLDVSGR